MSNIIQNIKTPWGTTYQLRTLSLEEARNLVSEHRGHLMPEFQTEYVRYYHLDNDAVVSMDPGGGIWFSSYLGYLANRQTSGLYIKKHINQSYPKDKIMYGLDGSKVKFAEIDKEEGKKLCNQFSNSITDSMALGYKMLKVDALKVLCFRHDWKYYIFDSRDDCNIFIDRTNFEMENSRVIFSNEKVVPQMIGRNPMGEKFSSNLEGLKNDLEKRLKIGENTLDYSVKSLTKVERALFQNLIDDAFKDKIFLPLLAYIGMTYNKMNGSKWELYVDPIFGTFIPDIRNKHGVFKQISLQLLILLNTTEEIYYPLTTVLYHRDEKK